MIKCIVMFPGGSTALSPCTYLKARGSTCWRFILFLPFYSHVGYSHDKIKKKAEKLGVPVRIIEEGEEYLAMFKNPHFGFGKKYKSLHRLQNSPAQTGRLYHERGKRRLYRHRRSRWPEANVAAQRSFKRHRKTGGVARVFIAAAFGWASCADHSRRARINRPRVLFSWFGRGRKPQFATRTSMGSI